MTSMTTVSCVCINNENGVEGIFTVSIYPEDSVHQLKEHIKQALTPALDHIPASRLSLWKLTTPLYLEEEPIEIYKKLGDIVFASNADQEGDVRPLFPLHTISDYWPNISVLSSTKYLHLVARLPPADLFPYINPQKRKYEDTEDEYRLSGTSLLHKLFKALWGQRSDDSIKEIKSEPVPDVYRALDATTTTCVVYDLSKVVGSDHLFPFHNRFLVRDEYVELYKHITSSTKPESFLLLGQSGIGKTVYLTYHLVQRLLAGQATIFSLNPVFRYLFHKSGVYNIRRDSLQSLLTTNPELNEEWPLVLIDFNVAQTQSDLAVFGSNPILAASSPNRARYKSWLKQSNAVSFVMKTWEWNEIFQARIFVSVKYDYSTDELRECFLKYGGCARLLLDRTPETIEFQIATAITSCPDIRKLVGKQNTIPEDESSALIKIEPYVNSEGSINRNFMYCEVISQHVFNQLMQAHQSIIAESFREISNLFQGQTPSGYVFEMHGHNAVFHLLSHPLKVRSLVSNKVTKFNIECTELRHFNPEDIGKIALSIYYVPLSANLPGVDSFISYRTPSGGQLHRVFFQFTLSKSHPVNPKFLDSLWKPGDPKWSLIFVVPKQIADQYKKQSWTPASNNKKWDSRVDQYVLGIEPDQFWTVDAT